MRNSLINFGSILASPSYFDLFNVPASFSQEVVDFLMNWWRLGISDASSLIFLTWIFLPRNFKLLKGWSCFQQKPEMLWKIISRYYTVMLCSFAMICVFLSGLWFRELQKLHNTHSAGWQWITMAKRSRHQLVHLSNIFIDYHSGRDWVRRWEINVAVKPETQQWCKLTWLVATKDFGFHSTLPTTTISSASFSEEV